MNKLGKVFCIGLVAGVIAYGENLYYSLPSFDKIVEKSFENPVSRHVTEGDVYTFEVPLKENYFGRPLKAEVTLKNLPPFSKGFGLEDTLTISLSEVDGDKTQIHNFKDGGLNGLDEQYFADERSAYRDTLNRINSQLEK